MADLTVNLVTLLQSVTSVMAVPGEVMTVTDDVMKSVKDVMNRSGQLMVMDKNFRTFIIIKSF